MRNVAPILLACALTLAAQKPLIEGDPSSPVRVLIYEDLQCPDCAAFRQMMDTQLIPRFQGAVAFEHRDFPLNKHAWARPAAVAARYFETISSPLAVEFRKATMAAQEQITPENLGEHVAAFARGHQVNPAQAVAALNDAALNARVEADYQEGVARGVARTPTVLVNGEPFIETFPAAAIMAHIERELAAAKPRP